jgi:hypothetical protein
MFAQGVSRELSEEQGADMNGNGIFDTKHHIAHLGVEGAIYEVG